MKEQKSTRCNPKPVDMYRDIIQVKGGDLKQLNPVKSNKNV